MKEFSPVVKITFTIIGFLVFALSFVFAFLNNVPTGFQDGNSTKNGASNIFINTVTDLNARYPSSFGPADFVFIIIWPLIYLWNTVGIIYMLASLFFTKKKSPILREPAMFPVFSLIFWSLSWGCSMGWLFAYDREILWLSMFLILASALSTYATLGFSYASYYKDTMILEEHDSRMLWLVRIIIHNGYAILAAWLTVAWKVMLHTVIAYEDSRGTDNYPANLRSSLTVEDAGTIALSILLVELIVWFVLENFVFEPYCRYTLSIYPALIFALSGTFSNDYVVPFSRNLILTLVGLIFVIIAFVVRVVLVYIRHKNRPRLDKYRSQEEIIKMDKM
uniref:uncharacterized protein LOC120332666 n=1 Tax=Styela clava TaxID=7725 RepID=UPI00193A0A6C|nr:uncharacterized protein LOC120332666 [Styela clava]